MKSLMVRANQTLKANRKNNKGFTLVELIIVVAIIAVLAAVLAPQYIKYIEKSRIGVDESYISEVAHNVAITAAISEKVAGQTVKVTFDVNGKLDVTGASASPSADETAAATYVKAELLELFPVAVQTFKSKHYTTSTNLTGLTLTLTTTGSVTIAGTVNLNT